MHTALENLFGSSSQETSSFGFGSLSFAQISPNQLDWIVTIGAIAMGFAMAWGLARVWSIKAMPKAIFILLFIALFTALTGSIYRNIRPAEAKSNVPWTTLVYKIDAQSKHQPLIPTAEIMSRLHARLEKHLSSDEFVIEALSNDQISISLPQPSEFELVRIKAAVGRNTVLEFRIAASPNEDRHAKLIELSKNSNSKTIHDPETNAPLGEWLDVRETSHIAAGSITRPHPEDPNSVQLLVYSDKYNVDGADLDHAYATYDEAARPAVGFTLTQAGATKFGKLTNRYAKGKSIPDDQKNHLVIVLDNKIQSAPSINEAITGGSGIINGVAADEVGFISAVLNAGQLPVPLESKPTLEKTGSAPERIIDQGNHLAAIVVTSILLFAFLVTSFFLAKRRARDDIPLAQLSPTVSSPTV